MQDKKGASQIVVVVGVPPTTALAIVALCCKYSFDKGLEREIYFDAKNRLFPYYARIGASRVAGLRMIIENPAAIKLINIYF